MSSLIRKFNPKAIPWPGSVFYDKLSRTSMFQDNFKLLARDIAGYCDTGRLLDVGTGPGWLLIHLHRVSPLYRLYGIDTSPSIIEKANRKLGEQELAGEIEIQTGAVGQIPYNDTYFDCVVSTGSLHH